MAKQGLAVGVEVAVLDMDGAACGLARIVSFDPTFNQWTTDGKRFRECTTWSKTGLSRDGSRKGQSIVPATDEHRRAVRVRALREKVARPSAWEGVTAEQLEAVAQVMGWV